LRYQSYLKERYLVLGGYIGGILFVIALTILSPLLLIPFYPNEFQYGAAFLITGVPLAIMGLFMRDKCRVEEEPSLAITEGMVTIVVSWLLAILVGAVPFMLINNLNFSQAIFESTSGWTTTGLSVVDVTRAPRLVLFYRSAIQLVGGAGFAIIVVSSITGPVGSGLNTAEGRDDQLAPNVRRSAALVLRMYVAYVVLGTVALYLAGRSVRMSLFDAVNHVFAAVSTGGFSTQVESIGFYDFAAVEAVIIVLMLLGGLNYLTAYVLLQRKFKAIYKNGEIQLSAFLLSVAALLLLFAVTISLFSDLSKSIRVAIFEAASAISTTGFSTVAYTDWPEFGWLMLIILMLIGGGSGSTAGGIKQFRIYVLIKALYWEIRKAFLPEHAVNRATIWRGDQKSFLSDQQVRRIALFTFLYMVLYFMGVLIVTAYGYSIKEAMFEVASVLSTVGLSVGITAADAPASLLWLQSFGMLLGRLEFFALVIGSIKLVTDVYQILKPTKSQVSH